MNIVLSLIPVLLFLIALVGLDSYKLVRVQAILGAIVAGCLTAAVSLIVNTTFLEVAGVPVDVLAKYIAPLIEEVFKLVYVVILFRRRRIGFMVDAAIYGFGVGAGFALMENIYFLQTIQDQNPLIWIIRGLGTAVMHGGTTAIASIVAKTYADRRDSESFAMFFPGLILAIIIHSVFNHFFLPPVLSTVVLLLVLPTLVVLVYRYSEQSTRDWLGIGFDSDVELLEMINNGTFTESRVGQYLLSLRDRFPGEVVADMLCLIRIRNELSIKAKGILLMREAGFRVDPSPETRAIFSEMKHLEKTIGPTGQIALAPFLRTSSRDLWQMHMLGAES